MSFCHEVKSELCAIKPAGCCRYAECYGMLLFGRSFCERDISLLTADSATAMRLSQLLQVCFGVAPTVSEGGVKRPTYLVTVDNPIDIKRILIKFGRYGKTAEVGVNPTMFKKECCIRAFIRGAFLSCGSVSDPNKSFHTDFSIKDNLLSDGLAAVLRSRGLNPKMYCRSGKHVIYFSSSTGIEDLFTVMDATQHTLELMNLQIYKDMRNRTNRLKNCDNGNISKMVEASIMQRRAIEYLKSCGKLETLPQDLYDAAHLRLDNPDASLSEMCALCKNRISRSGLNHRLERIIRLAEQERS